MPLLLPDIPAIHEPGEGVSLEPDAEASGHDDKTAREGTTPTSFDEAEAITNNENGPDATVSLTSCSSERAYMCSECDKKLVDTFYACITCSESYDFHMICFECDAQQKFTKAVPHQAGHVLLKVKDPLSRSPNGGGPETDDTSAAPQEDGEQQLLAALAQKLDALDARMEQLDLQLSDRIEKLVTERLEKMLGKHFDQLQDTFHQLAQFREASGA